MISWEFFPKKMTQFTKLLGNVITSIIEVKDKNDIDSFVCGGQARFLTNEIKGLDNFELLCALIKYGKKLWFRSAIEALSKERKSPDKQIVIDEKRKNSRRSTIWCIK